MIPTLLFYLFSGMMTASALMVVAARNPVHSVLFLILAFFNSAGLFLLMGAEFIAMLMVIVYVGAVAVLFLFVVMMMDINTATLRHGFLKYLPVGALVAAALVAELCIAIFSRQAIQDTIKATTPIPPAEQVSNTEALGLVLYTNYIYIFQMSGLILLVAMVGAIVLTLRSRDGVKRQKALTQVSRRKEDCIQVVSVQASRI